MSSISILFIYELNNVNIYTSKKTFTEAISGQEIADMVANDIDNEKIPTLSNTKLKRLFYHDIEFDMDVDILMSSCFTDKLKITIVLERVITKLFFLIF